MAVITFDFDNTIAMSHMDLESDEVKYVFEEYNDKIIEIMKKHIKDGNDVHIVTARIPEKEDLFPNDTVRAHLDRLSLSDYFTDDRVHYTNDTPKQEKLKELGSTLHYDDNMQEHIDNFGGIPIKNPYDFYSDTEYVGKVIIYDKENRVLILKRTDEGEKWDIPGGHIKDIEVNRGEEGIKGGTMREIAEETGLVVPFLLKIDHQDFTFKGKNSKIDFFITKYGVKAPEVNLKLQGFQENSEYKWISMKNIDKYADNGTQVIKRGIEMARNKGLLFEEEEYQEKVKAKHRKMKSKLIDTGINQDFGGGKGHSKAKTSRGNAPAGFGALEEDDGVKKKMISVKIKGKRKQCDLMREELDNIVADSEFDLSKLELKTSLHPDFWQNDTLNDEVKAKLMEIAEEFEKETEIEGKVEDITFTGSLASYNYHSKSDIDLHLLVDFKEIGKNGEIIKDLMNLLRIRWNETHNIMINGHEVEIYVQDSTEKHYSAGVYSLSDDKWLVKPSPEAKTLDYDAIVDKATSISDEIDDVRTQYRQKNYEKANEMAKKLSEKIKKLRSAGLEAGGIYSIENLAFKLIRNSGKMGDLIDFRSKSYDKMMSLGKIPSIKIKISNNMDEKQRK